MELGEFRKDPLKSILSLRFIEARLHTDANRNRDQILDLQQKYVGDVGLPNYIVLDPHTLEAHGRFAGIAHNAKRTADYVEFLDHGYSAAKGDGAN